MNTLETHSAEATCLEHSGARFRSRWGRLGRSAAIVSAVLLVTGLGGVASAGQTPTVAITQQTRAASFDVDFADCSELASITAITAEKARTAVPAAFTLANAVGGVPLA